MNLYRISLFVVLVTTAYNANMFAGDVKGYRMYLALGKDAEVKKNYILAEEYFRDAMKFSDDANELSEACFSRSSVNLNTFWKLTMIDGCSQDKPEVLKALDNYGIYFALGGIFEFLNNNRQKLNAAMLMKAAENIRGSSEKIRLEPGDWLNTIKIRRELNAECAKAMCELVASSHCFKDTVS